jgi:hypothetical protein
MVCTWQNRTCAPNRSSTVSVREWDLWNVGCDRGSVRLDAGELDHLRPFLGFVGDEFAKVGGREREHVATQAGKPCVELAVGEARVLVELLDDFGRRGLWCADAEPIILLAS